MSQPELKPLFVPLNTEHYEAFEDGSKDTEYRLYGARWNEKTCIVGRPAVLSKGYGKQNRMNRVISSFEVHPVEWFSTPKIGTISKIYDNRKGFGWQTKIACIKLANPQFISSK